MKRLLPLAIVLAVLLATVGGGLMFYRQRPPAVPAAALPPASLPGAEPAYARGPGNAGLVLEEFGDFECPPCGNLSPILDKLAEDYAGRLRFIYREFPMAVHAHARNAAAAAEAAGLQGKFWEMHDRLYQERFVWPRASNVARRFAEYAGSLGLDVARFQKDMEGEQVSRRIADDQKRGAALGVNRTPALLLNDHLIPPTAFTPEGLRQAMEAAGRETSR